MFGKTIAWILLIQLWAVVEAQLDCTCDPTKNQIPQIVDFLKSQGIDDPNTICPSDGTNPAKCNFAHLTCENTEGGTKYPMCARFEVPGMPFDYCAVSDTVTPDQVDQDGTAITIKKCNEKDQCTPTALPQEMREWDCSNRSFGETVPVPPTKSPPTEAPPAPSPDNGKGSAGAGGAGGSGGGKSPASASTKLSATVAGCLVGLGVSLIRF